MPSTSTRDLPASGPIVIFNLESLLIDTVAGVRCALDIESVNGVLGVAHSPRDAALRLSAQAMTRRCLQTLTRRSSTPHLH